MAVYSASLNFGTSFRDWFRLWITFFSSTLRALTFACLFRSSFCFRCCFVIKSVTIASSSISFPTISRMNGILSRIVLTKSNSVGDVIHHKKFLDFFSVVHINKYGKSLISSVLIYSYLRFLHSLVASKRVKF